MEHQRPSGGVHRRTVRGMAVAKRPPGTACLVVGRPRLPVVEAVAVAQTPVREVPTVARDTLVEQSSRSGGAILTGRVPILTGDDLSGWNALDAQLEKLPVFDAVWDLITERGREVNVDDIIDTLLLVNVDDIVDTLLLVGDNL